jgi:hypothetical protein
MRDRWLRDGVFFTKAEILRLGLDEAALDDLLRDGLLVPTSRTATGEPLFSATDVDRVAVVPWAELRKRMERKERRNDRDDNARKVR